MTLSEEVKDKVTQQYGHQAIIADWGSIVDELSQSFEWTGSKIRWSKVNEHKYLKLSGDYDDWIEQIIAFISDSVISNAINKSDGLYYINDSSLDFSIFIQSSKFSDFIKYAIKNIPQHHYFTDGQKKWCLVISSEGYVDFGFANKCV